ncbi:hypothetical protein GALMADRAFT_50952, partial [Galerina marginata CBS 339.88]
KKENSVTKISDKLLGLKWDSVNHSCAYDSLFTILFNVWSQNKIQWSDVLENHGNYAQTLLEGFKKIDNEGNNFQQARNTVRHKLQRDALQVFPNGNTGTDIRDLLTYMFQQSNEGDCDQIAKCSSCNYNAILNSTSRSLIFVTSSQHKSTNRMFEKWQYNNEDNCLDCNSKIIKTRTFNIKPNFVCFSFEVNVSISKKIKVIIEGKSVTHLPLRGIIYSGGHHFTARVVLGNENVWYHDGIETGIHCYKDNNLNTF